MEDRELRSWEDDGDLGRVKNFFAAFSPDEAAGERVRAKTHALTQERGKAKRPLKMPRLRYIIAAAALVLICAATVNIAARGDGSYGNDNFAAAPSASYVEDSVKSYEEMGQTEAAGRDVGNYLADSSVSEPMSEPQAAAGATGAAAPREDKIIYTMEAQLRVNSVAEAMRGLEAKARALGGYVAGSRQSNQDYWQYGSLTLRIPSEEFTLFSDALAEWGTVTDRYVYSDDVTESYFDVESRLKSWQAQEDRYLEFFSAAETVEEMILIESALDEVRREKEVLEGQLKYWDSKVAYSEVRLELTQQSTDVAVTDPWQPVSFSRTLAAAKNAVIKTVSVAWNGLNRAVVFLGYALPVLILLLVLWLAARAWLRRRKARRQAALAQAVGTETQKE
ncbi:MAG: DUF4349 domain-containing protein [Gracilibacteraceae bacterium]|jgi:hypothetical protein|nr:DUF4349 domain-containing protein [Gracilibacteraceae bacterium]